ncbi:MAG: diaminopimelate decarboxylase, partial [Duncaniella sp.]|nr:diaminopimelate decarboxylase [Duncaniella sp.]
MTRFPLEEFSHLDTPFYYYDLGLLERTLTEVKRTSRDDRFFVHYAIKANANPVILRRIQGAGLGIDAVSGGEISVAIEAGFRPNKIVFAGVGKTDREIRYALEKEIGGFNVESLAELEVIDSIAKEMRKTAVVFLRVNPDLDAHTHEYITTGLAENKFGI